MNRNFEKKLLVSLLGLWLMLPMSTFADATLSMPPVLDNTSVQKGAAVNIDLRREIEQELGKLPDFDVKGNKLMEIFTWNGAVGRGMIVAVREGKGRAAVCAIYERVGNSDFQLVSGQPFCSFSIPSGQFSKRASSIKFAAKIRQSYDAPLNDMWFELFYASQAGIFCDPSSRSEKFKCKGANGASGD